MARMSIHNQAHRLTVKRLDHVDISCYVSPFVKYILTLYRKYIISRTEDGQYLTSLRVTIISIESFSWCEYRYLMWLKLYMN